MTRGPSAPNEAQRDFPARHASIDAAAAFATDFCAAHGHARTAALRLSLVLEELLSNAIAHAYGGECDAVVRIRLVSDRAGLHVHCEDTGPPFDPLARAAASRDAIEAPLEDRPVGAVGLHLVGGLAADARYVREDGCNRLWLLLRAAPDSSSG